jgi:TRAP-type C4-dicarboxylate transport system permease small subunit
MHTVTIVVVFASLIVILGLIIWMLLHWRRFRHETDRLRAWQDVFGQRGGKLALVMWFVALAVLVGGLLAYQAQLTSMP